MPQQMESYVAGFYYSSIFETSRSDKAALPLQQVSYNLDQVITQLEPFALNL